MGQDVSISVGANTSALNTGLEQAKHAVEGFKEHASEQLSEVGGDFLKAFALGAIIEGVKGLFEEFGKLNDLSQRLGVSSESLQRLSEVTKLSGVEVEGLVKSLQKGTNNAVEAAQGNETLSKAFESLGINAQEFADASPEEQLLALAEGYQKGGSNAEKLNAILATLGKSGAELIPVLRAGPDALRDAMEEAAVASEETVNTLDDAGDNLEKLFGRLKVYGAEAINFIIKHVESLGGYLAVSVAFLSNLGNGFTAAKQAASDALQAMEDIKTEKEQAAAMEAATKKATTKLGTGGDDKAAADQAKKDEDELGKLKAENAKKEEDAYMRSLALLEKKAELERQLAEAQNATPTSDLEAERNKGRALDIAKELENVNKEVARDEEKAAKESADKAKKDALDKAKAEVQARKDAMKGAEDELKTEERVKTGISVDSLRQIGGGLANVNYNANAAKDDLQKQAVDYAKQQLDIAKQQLDIAKAAQSDLGDTSDGSFTD